MIQNRSIRGKWLIAMCLFVPAFSAIAASPLPARDYTDQQLLDAGWTEQQIAVLRAAAPRLSNVTDVKQKPLPAQEPYRSVFDQYLSFEYLPDTDWRKANDEVGRIGGWKTYARQVQREQALQAEQNKGAKQ